MPGRRARDALLVATAFVGSFSFWPALIALGSLFETMSEEFAWSRSQTTMAQLIFTAVSVASAPIIGPLIDRVGVRRLLLLGLISLPVPLVLIGLTTGSFTWWIAVWILASLAGQLVAPPIWSSGIARRFERRRGLALGLAACGFAAASAVTPLLLVRVIGLAEWRQFYFGMAGFLIVILLPLTFAFYRDGFEPPAGDTHNALRSASAPPGGKIDFRKDVIGTRRFLCLSAIVFLVSFVVGGMMIHLQPLFRALGLSAAAAASAYAFYGAGGILGRLAGGWLLDRFDTGPTPALPMCIFPVIASLLALLTNSAGPEVFASIAFLIGIAAGVEVDVVPYLVRRYFPSETFGRAYISLAAIFVGGAGAAPFIVSVWYDATGTYIGFLFASIILGLVATILLLLLGRYPANK